MTKAITQYLTRYAENEIQLLTKLNITVQKNYVLVIPAYKESIRFVEQLARHEQAQHILLIIILNEPDTDRGCTANKRFKDAIIQDAQSHTSSGHLHFISKYTLSMLLVDRCEKQAIPSKQGVGLARKVGSDLACALIENNTVTMPWIFSSDADAQLPQNYFSLPNNNASVSAYIFDFEHRCDNSASTNVLEHRPPTMVQQATHIYESCIKYYQQQLSKAGSPYAFYTLGSCLAISMPYYCQVRGFPKRAAAEDFYLLNKLAKVGRVTTLNAVCISIEARISDRVPFGTGPAVAAIVEKLRVNETISYYSPDIFTHVFEILNALPHIWHNMSNQNDYLEGINEITSHALCEAGFIQFLEKRRQQDKSLKQFEQHFHHWFDAFQTLKFVKRLQRTHYPNVEIDTLF